jgi:imidazolonepropionase-like amidohydrolase
MRKFLMIFFIVVSHCQIFAQSQILLIRNVSIVDVRNGILQKNQSVVINGNRITSIGKKASVPNGASIIDGTGKYLIPGLWDLHVHALTGKRYVYTFTLLIANGITGPHANTSFR